MLPETDDQEICSLLAKKRYDTINFFAFDQMPSYLNGVSAPLCNSGLDEFLIMPPPIHFDTLRHNRSNSYD
jgi:hypothetical protein